MSRTIRHSTLVSLLALVALVSSLLGAMPVQARPVAADGDDAAAIRVFSDADLPLVIADRSAKPAQAALQALQLQRSGPLAAAAALKWDISSTEALDGTRSVVRLNQQVQGWPVFGGALALQVENGRLRTASGAYVVPATAVEKPLLTAEAARRLALTYLRNAPPQHADINPHDDDDAKSERFAQAKVRETELVYFEPTLFDLSPAQRGAAFRVLVESGDGSEAATVLVNARTGKIGLAYNEWHSARNRTVRDANNVSTLSGTVCAGEGSVSASATADCRAAYTYTGNTYDYFLSAHNRDSFDNAGAPMIAVVRYGTMPNAFWNGSVTAYGPGFATLDVVAHEWTHAVTQYTAGLIYQGQSGALNESFSDVFGAMVDADDWLMGEDTPIGAIRNLANPPQYNQPDRMANFYCMSGDNGGVHYNSGIPNKLAYLLAQGGTFNGQTVTAIGRNATAAIFYRTLVGSLTPTATFNQTAAALVNAAQTLYGAGSTQALQTQNAVNAVEMDEAWPCGSTSVTPDSYEVDNTPAAAKSITPNGSNASGHNFHTDGDIDYHVFTATAGTTYVISTSGLGLAADTVLSLFAANGTTLLAMNDDEGSGSLASRIAYTADTAGPLYLAVENYGGSGGSGTSYTVGVTAASVSTPADAYEPDNSQSAARRYVIGSAPQTRNFHTAGDQDWIVFAATAGRTYQLETTDGGATADTLLRLYSADGSMLAENDDSQAGTGARIDWVATASADLFVRVTNYADAYGSTTGYQFALTEVTAVEGDEYEPDDASAAATALELDVAQTHSFHQPGDVDWLELNLSGQRSFTLSTADLAEGTDTVLELYAANGDLLAQNDDTNGLASQLVIVTVADTTYFVRVRNYSASQGRPAMTYSVRIVEDGSGLDVDAQEPDDSAADATEIVPGSNGQAATLSYNFHQAGDQDWLQFSADAGTTYLIETRQLAARADTVMSLFAADGTTRLAYDDDSGDGYASRLNWQAPSSGVYYVRIQHYFWSVAGDETGYTFAISGQDGAIGGDDYEVDNSAAQASQLVVDADGQLHTFHLESDGDWMAFSASAGQSYELSTDQLGSRADTVLELYATDGTTLLARNDDARGGTLASFIQWRALDSGTYYLRATPYGVWNTGADSNYRVQAVSVGDSYEPDDEAALATPIVVDDEPQPHDLTAGDYDWLVFDAVNGQAYQITTSALGSCSDTVLDLYLPANLTTPAASNDDYSGLASQISWPATATGPLYVRVRHYSAGSGGDCATYSVGVSTTAVTGIDDYEVDDTREAAVPLLVGTDQAHTLHRAGDSDWVSLTVSAGSRYTVETRDLSRCVDTILTLYAANGDFVAQNDDYAWPSLSSRLSWTAASSGVVYLSVRDYLPQTGGPDCSYMLRASVSGSSNGDAYEPDDSSASVTNALPVNGAAQSHSFHRVEDVDWLSVATTAGGVYSVRTLNLGSAADTVLELYAVSANGTISFVSANDDDWSLPDLWASRVSWTASADYTYLIRVRPWGSSGGRDGSTYDIAATSGAAAQPAVTAAADGRLQLVGGTSDGSARAGNEISTVISAVGAAAGYKLIVDDKQGGLELIAVEPLSPGGARLATAGVWSAVQRDGRLQMTVSATRSSDAAAPLVRLRWRVTGSANGKYVHLPIRLVGQAADGSSWSAGSQIISLPLAGDLKLEDVSPAEVELEGQAEVYLQVSGLGGILPKVYLVDVETQAVQQVSDVSFVDGSTESIRLRMDGSIKAGSYKVRVTVGSEMELSAETVRLIAPDYRLFVPSVSR